MIHRQKIEGGEVPELDIDMLLILMPSFLNQIGSWVASFLLRVNAGFFD